MPHSTIPAYLSQWASELPDQVWLRDRQGDTFTQWSWSQARAEVDAVASWLEKNFPAQTRVAILSRNCAHWVLADYAIISAGNISVPLFTSMAAETAEYIINFSEADVLVLGEATNWAQIQPLLPARVKVITLPGVECEGATSWQTIVSECSGQVPRHQCQHDELVSLVFTSGTTGLPKGAMQTHDSMLVRMQRFVEHFNVGENPRFLSYLPLAHIAERQLVAIQSLLSHGSVVFNESLATLSRDMNETRPHFFFGAPRVWEQLQQGVLAAVGSQQALDELLAADAAAIGAAVRDKLGLAEAHYLLSAAAPISRALVEWFEQLGIIIMEGYGQTEAMGLTANLDGERKIGTIGKAADDVEVRLSAEGELQVKAPGLSTGYYKNPEKTAETFVDGWVYTGDKAIIDDEGFITLTGRVKDYFKTVHGKFVAPAPIEDHFSGNPYCEQQCLLGRGYSKTVMVSVLSETARALARDELEAAMLDCVARVNELIDKHERIGVVIVSETPWTVDNAILTPTLKIRRDEIEARFGERAAELATQAARQGEVLVVWDQVP
jgi:long-chain acyl-CoA synthetase